MSIFLITVSSMANDQAHYPIHKLDSVMNNQDHYLEQKRARIKDMMIDLKQAERENNINKLFQLYDTLFHEYKSFVYDSSFHYAAKYHKLAEETGIKTRIWDGEIKMGFALLSGGLFAESLDILQSLDPYNMPKQLRKAYYNTIARAYYDLADYNEDKYYETRYIQKGIMYSDSAIDLMGKDTPEYWMAVGLKKMKTSDIKGSAEAFEHLLASYTLPDHKYAIATSSLGYIYSLLDKEDQAINMLIQAAIADIKSSTKETVALRNLAFHLHNQGDINRAYRYIKISLENATFYNARHRKVEVSSVLPIIEGKRTAIIEKQNDQLQKYSVAISVLAVLTIIFSIIVYVQLKKLKTTRRYLQKINQKLQEANIIKEEYIGFFFNLNSEYIEKLRSYQKTVYQKAMAKRYDELANVIKNSDLRHEREHLLSNFDKIFLKLFPNFVQEFNKFFREEDHFELHNDELLNTDLRIFALIRLGITEIEKIAKFLNYSVNTIYTYKTKIKNKAIVPREQFEEKIMQIQAF